MTHCFTISKFDLPTDPDPSKRNKMSRAKAGHPKQKIEIAAVMTKQDVLSSVLTAAFVTL